MDHQEDFRDDPDHEANQPVGSRLVAARRNIVRNIRIPWEPQQEFVIALDELLHSAEGNPGSPQPGVRLLATSYAGKSTGARDYVREVMERREHAPGTTPVVYVKLDPDGTVGSLGTDILKALGERRPDSLTPGRRWERARRCLRDHRVMLIIFDEIQRATRRPTISGVIASKLLDIMDDEDGSCACAFVGKTNAKSIFKNSFDLGNRLDAPVHMQPLVWANTADKEAFIEFVDAFDEALYERGVTAGKSGFKEEDLAETLMEASNGLIGQFSRIVETAVMNISRRGDDAITREDLALAVDEWSVGNERIGYNPFHRKDEASGGKRP